MDAPPSLLALDDPTVALAFRAAGIGVWAWDTATDRIRVTERLAGILGFTSDTFPPDLEGFLAIVHPDDRSAILDTVAEHKQQGGPLLVEAACRLADGTGFRRLRIRGQRSDSGDVTVGIAEDVSDVDAHVAVIQRNERRLREAQRIARVGSWEFDLATQTVHWSHETFLLFGFDPAQGAPTYEQYLACIPDDEKPKLATAIQGTLASGTPYDFDQRIVRRDGAERWIRAKGEPLRDGAGTIIGLAGTVADITERKRAEDDLRRLGEEAQAAAKAKSAFLANVSHELRTPMNGVLGMLSLLLESPLQPAQKQYAWTAYSAAEGLLHLLNDLLDFSKIEAGKLELQSVAFAPRESLQTTVQLWQARAQEKGLALAAAVDPDVPEILRGDSLRIRQVVLNLVSNAVKFTARGHVLVRLALADQDADSVLLRITVTDSGTGISADDRARLFQPFTQLHQPDGVTPGTGLGLSISRRLAELLGGEIGVESEPGAGSTFWFTARCYRAPSTAVPRRDTTRSAETDGTQIAGGKRLLVVDDHPVNRLVALRLLERTGATIDVATTGAEALAAAARQRYDLVLMDCQMPEMNGFDASRAIRRLERERGTRPVPIVAMTANAMAEDRERCLAAGMDDHIAKPIDRPTLFDAVLRWTGDAAPAAGRTLVDAPATPVAATEPPSVTMAAASPGAPDFMPTARRFVHDLANAVQAEDATRFEDTSGWLLSLAQRAGHAGLVTLVEELRGAPRAGADDWTGLIYGVRRIQQEMERIRTTAG